MKKIVVKEARRLMKKEIELRINTCFLNTLYMVETFDEDEAVPYYECFIKGLAVAGAISEDLAKELRSALVYAACTEWEPEPEPETKTTYTVVWKWKTARTEDVIDGYRDSYSAWHTVKDLEKKFGDGLEYMYMIEEVEECPSVNDWQRCTSR